MSRTVVNVPLNQDPAQFHEIAKSILKAEGYKETTYKKNEIVWKKGLGLLTAMHFIKVEYQPGMMVISGWVSLFGLFGLSFGEDRLDGFSAAIPKQSTKKTMDKVILAASGQPVA